jgi:hypothetical protein
MLTRDQVLEIKAMADAVPPEEWFHYKRTCTTSGALARFVTHTSTDVPALCDTVLALMDEHDEVVRWHGELRQKIEQRTCDAEKCDSAPTLEMIQMSPGYNNPIPTRKEHDNGNDTRAD